MNDLLLMNVPDARDKLRKKFASVFFFQVAMGQDVVEELASRCVFENDPNVFVRFDNVI